MPLLLFRTFFALLCCLGYPASFARDIQEAKSPLSDHLPAHAEIAKIEVWMPPTTGITPSAVLTGQTGTFTPLTDTASGSDVWGSALWLRLTLRQTARQETQQLSSHSVLEIPKNYLDKARLFSPTAEGWGVQQAGDGIAPGKWAVIGLHPRFVLPSAEQLKAAGGEQVLYLLIEHKSPYRLVIEVQSLAQSNAGMQSRLLTLGLLLGALVMVSVMVGALAWHTRDGIYTWYGLYALSACLASVSHSGLAHWLLWPVDGYWPGVAVLVFLMAAVACQLQFSRLAFLSPQGQSKYPMTLLTHVLTWMSVGCALAFALFPTHWQSNYFLGLGVIGLSMVVVTCWVALACQQGQRLALVWLLAYIPLFGTVSLGLLEGVGLLGQYRFDYQSPIYAAGVEVIILGIALQWFARERHGEKERQKALASTDPLTGFASARSFHKQLHQVWQSPEDSEPDTAVAYVSLRNDNTSSQRMERLLMRSVRVLRAATSNQDVVARLDGRVLALLLPGAGMGEPLSQRLSRIIALGLMPDSADPHADVLKFRIAYTTRKHYQHTAQQLDADLRHLLQEQEGWGSRPIRVIDHRKRVAARPREVMDSTGLEQMWQQALKEEKQQSRQVSFPPTTAPSPLK